jgi:hypothetical protein
MSVSRIPKPAAVRMKHGMPSDASSALASSCADKRMQTTATCFTTSVLSE